METKEDLKALALKACTCPIFRAATNSATFPNAAVELLFVAPPAD